MSGEAEIRAVGFVGSPPDLRTTPAGRELAELRLAVGVSRKDSTSGEWSELRTDWYDVTAWGKLVSVAAQIGKGDHVVVEGYLEPCAYLTKAGEAAPAVKITARTLSVIPRVKASA